MSHHTTAAPAAPATYGLMAEFETPGKLQEAVERTANNGFTKMDAYSPFPIEGLAESMDFHTKLPAIVLGAGLTGALTGFSMQYFAAVIDYPISIGGKPLNSWPMWIPISFELTILFAGLSAVIFMLALNGFPQPYHPVFNVKRFEHASSDSFFMVIESNDPKFDATATRQFLESLKPKEIFVVEN